MEKREVAVTQDDEAFEWKFRMISTSASTRKTIKLHELLQLMEDESKKTAAIISPKFKLAGVEFSIDVYPEDTSAPGFIGVFLHNYSNDDPTTSVTFKESSGVERSWKMERDQAGKIEGYHQFLSHKKYREWAKDHGDVLKLDIVVTLHSKAEGDGWTR